MEYPYVRLRKDDLDKLRKCRGKEVELIFSHWEYNINVNYRREEPLTTCLEGALSYNVTNPDDLKKSLHFADGEFLLSHLRIKPVEDSEFYSFVSGVVPVTVGMFGDSETSATSLCGIRYKDEVLLDFGEGHSTINEKNVLALLGLSNEEDRKKVLKAIDCSFGYCRCVVHSENNSDREIRKFNDEEVKAILKHDEEVKAILKQYLRENDQ